MNLGYVVWEVDGFDFGSAEVADRPLWVGGEFHDVIYILVNGNASPVSQFLHLFAVAVLTVRMDQPFSGMAEHMWWALIRLTSQRLPQNLKIRIYCKR